MRTLQRLARITQVVARYRLDAIPESSNLPWYARWFLALMPWRWLPAGSEPRGVRIRRAREDLGPIFVKFGQMLSTRRDLLPDDIADELQKLQDQVPAFSGDRARAIIERALGQPIEDVFREFDTQPLASASVAQVHAATLRDGEQVVVKVIRPGIHRVIDKDLALLFTLARLLERYWIDGPRLRPVEIVSDYQHTISAELDLLVEAANTSHLRHNFENSPLLYVPQVHWEYTRRNMLVLERIHGVPISEIRELRSRGTDMKKLAERGVEIFFTQVFRDSFFHADMHPGNIFVNIEDPQNPQYIAVDCGIIGSLTPEDQHYLARNLLAFFRRDYRQVAELHIESGWVPAQTRVTEFESAIRSVCEPIFEKPLEDISFGHLLLRLFQTARRFNMEVQPQLVLLQKTLLNIEGLGRQLYPQLNLWTTAQPYLERWMRERMGPASLLRAFQDHAPDWLEQFPALPQLTFDALQRFRQLDQLARDQQTLLTEMNRELKRDRGVNWGLLAGSGFLLSAVAVASNFSITVADRIPATSWILALIGVWLVSQRRR